MSKVLVLAEARGNSVHPVTYELLGKGRELANTLGYNLDCLLLCEAGGDGAEEMNYFGADTVYVMQSPTFAYPEEYLFKSNIVRFINEQKPDIVLAGATDFGRSLAPRVAAALDTGLTADCTDLEIGENGSLIQIRPAFSDNILAHIISQRLPQMATVRHGEFAMLARDTRRQINIVHISPYVETYSGTVVTVLTKQTGRELTEADVVVACGRGIKAAEDIELIQQLANCMGGQVGFSRALVDAGMVDATYQIGYSGVRVRPRIYIACGISGAAQHIAGMKGADTIIAINRDPSAPIFGICDIGYVGDLYQVIPQMIKELGVIS